MLLSTIQRKVLPDPGIFLSLLKFQELSESLYDLSKCFMLSVCLLGFLKYLGVYLTHDSTWSEHVKQISTKAKRLIGLIYNFSSCAILMQLYKLRIRSHLEYASVVWSPHLEKRQENARRCPKVRITHVNQALGL